MRRRVAAGHLHRLYRGVYAVGHTELSREGRWIAAVFAFGPKAALSHDSAASLWQLSPATSAVVHVTVPAASSAPASASTTPPPTRADTTLRHNICNHPRAHPRRHGLGSATDPSHLERSFLRLLRSHDLLICPRPTKVGPYEVDFLWRPNALIVEVDGYAYHSSRASFESDRPRDRGSNAAATVVLHFTYREVTDRWGCVTAELRAQLQR